MGVYARLNNEGQLYTEDHYSIGYFSLMEGSLPMGIQVLPCHKKRPNLNTLLIVSLLINIPCKDFKTDPALHFSLQAPPKARSHTTVWESLV